MTTTADWPDGLLLTFYGDDFTGSTDAMEAMTAAGVPTVLCLRMPTPELLARLPAARCVGLAGSSRGRSPAWMDAELPAAFGALAALGAPILHYKVCSTFDSSPAIGSIGRAIDLGTRCMPGTWSPTIVGAPRLGRYQAFGNLFATANGVGYRLDRHPTMARHPVTPMAEADLTRHLARQTSRPIALIDLIQLRTRQADARLQTLQSPAVPVVLLDVLDEETLQAAGELVWSQRGPGLFSASSSGLQYALTAHWRAAGLLPEARSLPPTAPADVIAAVSGSCSPVTAGQIAWARQHGFVTEGLRLPAALSASTRDAEIERAVDIGVSAIVRGRSALIFSAQGPDDPNVSRFDTMAADAGLDRRTAAGIVGTCLARIMRGLLERTAVRRIVVAGGDSSGEVASALGIDALTVQSRLSPGAPLCRAWSSEPGRDGIQIALKGGQMGGEDFFGLALNGTR